QARVHSSSTLLAGDLYGCRSNSAASRPMSSLPTPIWLPPCPAPLWRCSATRVRFVVLGPASSLSGVSTTTSSGRSRRLPSAAPRNHLGHQQRPQSSLAHWEGLCPAPTQSRQRGQERITKKVVWLYTSDVLSRPLPVCYDTSDGGKRYSDRGYFFEPTVLV